MIELGEQNTIQLEADINNINTEIAVLMKYQGWYLARCIVSIILCELAHTYVLKIVSKGQF